MKITRRAVADQLLHRGADPAIEVGRQGSRWSGKSVSSVSGVRDGSPGGPLLSHDQEDEKRGEFRAGELLAVDVRGGQRSDKVVTGASRALGR
jgi:hypothetical protein